MMIRFINAPKYFLGVQIQIAINSVQGTNYPYLYYVILAKREAKLFRNNENIIKSTKCRATKLVIEEKSEKDIDVLVVRQFTTRQSGYYTPSKVSIEIVKTTIDLVRKLIIPVENK